MMTSPPTTTIYLSDNEGSADFMEPEDKVNEQDEEYQEDTMTDEPKLLPFMTISTPSLQCLDKS